VSHGGTKTKPRSNPGLLIWGDSMDWFTEAKKLREQDPKKWTYRALGEKFNRSRDYVKKRFNIERSRECKGTEERKPTFKLSNGIYYISNNSKSNPRTVKITEENLKQLKRLYCETGLTIPAICRELEITRSDFILIKTAFGITHDDIPYTDDELKNRDVEELVKETLERKKKQYFLRLQSKEVEELKKEVAAYRQKDYMLQKAHQLVTEHFAEFAKSYEGPMIPMHKPVKSGLLLEVPIVDLHLSKLAWEPETGENYDSKIAEKRFMAVIYDVVERVKGMEFEKILFPVGNDFFNCDTQTGTTTAGTKQDNDSRLRKMYGKGVELLVRGIDILAQIAPVDVFVVPGNHDEITSYHALMYLSAWFKNNENVTVDTDPKMRKYREFGNCLIGFTHTDKEKKRIFGCMQIEKPEAWGRTKYREWHGAHLHSEQVKEDFGVIVRNLSSVTGTDQWHYESGYVGAVAKSQSFIWDKKLGLRDILLTTITG